MTTTAVRWDELLLETDRIARSLQRDTAVPDEAVEFIQDLESWLPAAAPMRLDADPYLTTALFAAAYRAANALRRRDAPQRRLEVRLAVEQFRHALRDIVAAEPFGAGVPVSEVLARTVELAAVSQPQMAELLGVSTRQLQRWLAPAGPRPAGTDDARVRIVGQLVNQLRHVFTGPGVVAWFGREHPTLHVRPIDLLDDPLAYPTILAAAAGSRAMVG